MKNKVFKISIVVVSIVLAIAILYIALDVLFSLSEQHGSRLTFTKAEKKEIKKLSRRYNCKIHITYDYVISENGEKKPIFDSTSSYYITFNWKDKDVGISICQQDIDWLKQFSLNLLPELISKLKYIGNYHNIKFNFSVDDDLDPVNGFICYKQVTLIRTKKLYHAN